MGIGFAILVSTSPLPVPVLEIYDIKKVNTINIVQRTSAIFIHH